MLIRMPSSETPEVPNSRDGAERRRPLNNLLSVRRVAVITACVLFGSALGFAIAALRSDDTSTRQTFTAIVLALIAPALYVLERGYRNNRSLIRESRDRVREAERSFENAVRRDATPVIGGDLHGDLHVWYGRPGNGTATDVPVPRPDGDSAVPPVEGRRIALAEQWELTHARLELYHVIAQDQAKKSFRNAQISMGLGFALLVGFIAVALKASNATGSIVAGGLGAVAAALAGYVSKTFVKSQESAATHLRSYFDQPLEFSRYLAAERLIVDAGLADEQRREVLMALVQAMVASPAAPGAPAAASGQQQPAQAP